MLNSNFFLSSMKKKFRYVFWLRSIKNKDNLDWRLKNPWPCYSFESIDFISQSLPTDGVVFEYGSGTSTLWYQNHCTNTISVEHNQFWYETIQRRINSNSQITLFPEKLVESSTKNIYKSIVEPQRSFEDYVKSIDRYPDNHFDLVSVDGRARTGCIFHAAFKVRVGGMLVLDNSHRERYKEGIDFLRRKEWAENYFEGNGPYIREPQHTTVFIKIKEQQTRVE